MSGRHFPNWLDAFIKYSGYGEAPEEALFWTGVGTVAGALRRNVWIDQGYFQWYSNHYIILVAPPGVISKSTTMNIGFNLLREVPGVKFGPDSITWQALVGAMAEAREDVAYPDGSFIPACALTIASDELGNFLDIENTEMLNVLISMFDAKQGTFQKITKMAGNDLVPNPWLNFMACTTPAWIAGGFNDLTAQGGFVSRCLFVFADRKRRLVALPSRHMPANMQEMREQLVQDLERIGTLRGQFTITEEAVNYEEQRYHSHWNGASRNFDMERFGGYWARKQTHVFKLAMVLSAAEGPSLRIEKQHLEAAVAHITRTESNLSRVFELIGRSPDSRVAADILAFVGRLGTVDRAALTAHFMTKYGKLEIDRGVDTVLAAGKCRLVQMPDGPALTVRREGPGGARPRAPDAAPSAPEVSPLPPGSGPSSAAVEVTVEPTPPTGPSPEVPPR